MSDAVKLRVIRAPNPSALTGPGTNSFLIGEEGVAVIDPGPDDPGHIAAILAAAQGRISHILVTHAHLDHSAGAARLSAASGAPVLAFGPAGAGRSPVMQRLAGAGDMKGAEGADEGFRPDMRLADAERVSGADWTLEAIHTPGHMGCHLSFRLGDAVFCGDLAMGWSTTLISPPDGDLIDYLRSLERLARLAPRILYPAHGAPIEAPLPRLAELAAHRRERTAQVLAALEAGPATAAELAARIYAGLPGPLLAAAARNVLAHLIALGELGAAEPTAVALADAPWTRRQG
ncbi:MBL fold metallo-hydrolase [Paracoccus contaminans]|uniref:MBL fold metallo-hydrolase n=1 Tax=Paracoccus contaminans TaxID=1945662 RepID=A0A1W6CZ21_9RHOB|nr:MBL fold metallo-hydrolase [Paracoccus contaminans]ARJ70096.1 MBL fold metallo-hydrolase [Paracoccus contaminans]